MRVQGSSCEDGTGRVEQPWTHGDRAGAASPGYPLTQVSDR